MINFNTARILVISPTPADREDMKRFFARMPFELLANDFVVGEMRSTDDYDFAIFDARNLPPMPNEKAVAEKLTDEDRAYLQLLEKYLKSPIRYIVWYGEYYHDLNRERCPSANSKFTLFARIRELMDFITYYHHTLTPTTPAATTASSTK